MQAIKDKKYSPKLLKENSDLYQWKSDHDSKATVVNYIFNIDLDWMHLVGCVRVLLSLRAQFG